MGGGRDGVATRRGHGPGHVAAIGIANQRETTVVWDRRTGQPIHNAIVWQDRRTSQFCDRLKQQGQADTIQQKTGLVIDAYFSGSKVRWLLDNVPGRGRGRARAIGVRHDRFLAGLELMVARLHVTDASNASRTMLYNIQRAGGMTSSAAAGHPAVGAAGGPLVSAKFMAKHAQSCFGGPIRIAGMAGDQQAALFGQTCFTAGYAKNTDGTGCFLLMNVGAEAVASRHRLLTSVAWELGGKVEYALEGSVFIGGAVVQWLRDGLGIVKSAAQIEPLAASVPDPGGVYLVPGVRGPGARTGTSMPAARLPASPAAPARPTARAALESIAYQVADVLDVMRRDAGGAIRSPRMGGRPPTTCCSRSRRTCCGCR